MDKEYNVRDTALALGVRLNWVYQLIWNNLLPGAHKAGREWRIPAKAVEARKKGVHDANNRRR